MLNRLYNLKMSFVYAWRGIRFCVTHEKNMRIHIVVACAVLFLSVFYDFSAAEAAILIITCAIVMALEMINTAIEVIIDKVSPQYSALAKVGKDVAAGAVFVAALSAIIVGITMFWDVERFKIIWLFFTSDITNAALLLGFVSAAILFINSGKKRNIGKTNVTIKKL